MRRAITTGRIAPPVGPFSPGVVAGSVVYVSGQVGQDPASGRLVQGGVGAQLEQAIANVAAILGAAGRSLDEVTRVGLYLTNMDDFAAANAVYGRHFTAPHPARTTIAVVSLPLGASVELDVVAHAVEP
jgi:2-iminobutanoate/2-iminopropanoate deaminase